MFINIKPIWAEKLQCLNDVYTSALMSLLTDIAALPTIFPQPACTGKINDPVLPEPSNIMWHLQKAQKDEKQRLKHGNFQRSAICKFRGNTFWWVIEEREFSEARHCLCLCRSGISMKKQHLHTVISISFTEDGSFTEPTRWWWRWRVGEDGGRWRWVTSEGSRWRQCS